MKVSFQCTALAGVNKVGDLQKDDKGYYEVVLGGFDAYNESQEYYPMKAAQALFDRSSAFMRRINTGNLRGEVGHPRFEPGMTDLAYFNRLVDIYEPNICLHIRSIDLSENLLRNADGSPMIAAVGRICPSGANERYLERQLENREENVCFSVRSFTNDVRRNGRVERLMQQLITYDQVNEPGIAKASKYNTPSLESLNQGSFKEFNLHTLREQLDEAPQGVGLESSNIVDSMIQDLGTFTTDLEPRSKTFLFGSTKPVAMRF